MSTSCISFKDNSFWENDIIIFIALKLLLNSKQNRPKWLNVYFNKVLEYIIDVQPIGTTELYIDTYFEKYFKRIKFKIYIQNTINEFNLSEGRFSYLEVDNMLNTEFSKFHKEGGIEKKYAKNFLEKLISIMIIK